MRKFFLVIHFAFLFSWIGTNCQVHVLTQHNDFARTGANLNETILNTSNVVPYSFGKLFEYPVNGHVYAQPLYINALEIPGKGTRNVILIATMHNDVYAFDADNAAEASSPLWKVNLGPSVPMPDPIIGKACGEYNDIKIEIGILSTPFIELSTKTIYLVAKTKENGQYIDRIHMLDLVTGLEKIGSPKIIQGSAIGSGVGGTNGNIPFNSAYENQRSALAVSKGILYICYAGYCDTPPYHGWIFGYDATDLSQKIVFNTTPNGDEGGIWMSGQGPAIDTTGDLYVITGNGAFNPASKDYGDCFLRLRPNGNSLQVIDYFAPYNQAYLDQVDLDLGSDGALLIPGTNLVTGSGKEGVLYLINRDNMGKFNAAKDTNLQSFKTFNGHLHGSTVYWSDAVGTGLTYWWSEYDKLKAFRIINGRFNIIPAMLGPQAPNQGMPGSMLSISANGNTPGSAILWSTIPTTEDANHATVDGMLRAFDAADISRELWNSEQLTSRDRLGKFAKFCSPTIANGKVYASTFSNKVMVYGVAEPGKLREPENPTNTINGLDYQYYEGEWNYLPDFGLIFPVKSGSIDNISFSPIKQQDNFALKFTGFLDIPIDGYYTFFLNSDDGSKLFIGDLNLINNDGLHAASESSGRIGLKAGKHAITISFFEKGGEQVLNFIYEGPGVGKQPVPAAKLYRIKIAPYEIKLYPTITREQLNLFSGSSITPGTELAVYNALGQLVIKSRITGRVSEINTSRLQSGVYFLHVRINGKKIVQRFIKT
ncbi:MAG: PA14 domain-containing protein [Chitinophagaceae bacterium]